MIPHASRGLVPNVRRRRVQRSSLLIALICAVTTLFATADEPPKKYTMSFDRRASIGERFKLTCSLKSTENATFAEKEGRDPWKRVSSASCEGVWTTLAIGENALPSKVSLTIGRLTYKVDDGDEQSLPPGRVITAEVKDGVTVFSMTDGEIPGEVNNLLHNFMRLRSGPDPSADERYGSKVPRSVGEEWPVGAKATAAAFGVNGSKVAEKDIRGSVTLKGLRHVDGVECLVIEDDYRAANVTPKVPMADRLDTVGDFHEHATVLLPVGVPKKRIGLSVVTEMETRYTWKPGDGSATPVVQTWRVEFDEHSVSIERAK